MTKKKPKTKALMSMLFSYLAISKILYYFSYITTTDVGNIGEMFMPLFNRLISRDFVIIVFVVVSHFIEQKLLQKLEKRNVLKHVAVHVVGYITLVALYYSYFFILRLFFPVTSSMSPGEMLGNILIAYIFGAAFLEVKTWFKSKQYEKAKPTDAEDKLSALETLHNSGVLTDDEFESKKALVEN